MLARDPRHHLHGRQRFWRAVCRVAERNPSKRALPSHRHQIFFRWALQGDIVLASTAGVSIAREQSTEDVSEVIQVTDEEAELLLQKYRKQEQSVASVHTVTSTPPAEVYIPNTRVFELIDSHSHQAALNSDHCPLLRQELESMLEHLRLRQLCD